MANYYVSEGNRIGGQDAQPMGTAAKLVKASVAVTKGQMVEVTGDWTVGPAGDLSAKVVGVAFNDAKIGENVTVETEGFVKLTASGAITAGQEITCAAAGKVKAVSAATDKRIGIAFAGATDGNAVYVKLR